MKSPLHSMTMHSLLFFTVMSVTAIFGISGCGGKAVISSVTLNLELGTAPVSAPAEIETDNIVVLRCSQYSENTLDVVIQTSKSMRMTADYLIFIDTVNMNAGENVVLAILVTVTGKEYEYDLGTARQYMVTLPSAEKAVNGFGIAYADWEYGALSGSEQFPCCE